jgi:hypothetical protein
MRQRAVPSASAPLRVLIAAIPDERLARLVIEMMSLNGLGPSTIATAPAESPPIIRKRVGWPKGKKRGPRRDKGVKRGPRTVPAATIATPVAPAPVTPVTPDSKPAPRGHTRGAQDRQNAKRREKRAAARAIRESNGANGAASNGKAHGVADSTGPGPSAARRLWNHAQRIAPSTPWKAVAGALGTNMAQTVDAWRNKSLPPGIDHDAIERFLAGPIS